MKASLRMAPIFFLVHSIMPVWIFLRLLRISDGTERWANTLISYIVDIPLVPIFLWFQNSPQMGQSSFINTGISFVFGGLIYAPIGWLLGYLLFDRRKKNHQQPDREATQESAPSAAP